MVNDTIIAISTPPGRGGIGIVRLSGPDARQIALPSIRLRNPLAPGRVRFAEIRDTNTDTILDEAVVTLHASPNSYTTEDTIEIACHGAPVLLDALLRACIARGARLAEPGEFTQRAFLAGRLDLTQAEAVHDLIESTTLHQARIAAAQLGGSLSKTITPLKLRLIELIVSIEAGVDFAEDDLDLISEQEIERRIINILDPLQTLAATYSYGRIVRDGFTLAIIGRPNAGKSSLFNRLLSRERAIVTDQPGTTRDPISERLSIEGIPVELLDTAGLRIAPQGPEGEAERQGIERTSVAMAEADLVLHVLDAGLLTDGMLEDDKRTIASLQERPHLIVLNKNDLRPADSPPLPQDIAPNTIVVSALTGEGLEELRQAILATLTRTSPAAETALLTNARQHTAITQATTTLNTALIASKGSIPHEMLLLDLYAALEALDRLTGSTSTDDILNLIFSTFCIGK